MNQESSKPATEHRNEPRQERAQKMVKKILDTTKEILRAEGLDYLSTHAVAKKGGIAVGTIYRYFPNKEALLLAIFAELQSNIFDTFDKFESEPYLSLPKEEYFSQLLFALKTTEREGEVISELVKAIHLFPELYKFDIQHAEKFSERFASLLKQFGSKLPIERLQHLMKFIYALDWGTWLFRSAFCDDPDDTLQMELIAANAIFMFCFEQPITLKPITNG